MEVEAAEIERPACLTATEVLCCSPVLEVLVVRDNMKGLRKAFEIVLSVFQCANNGQHFFIVYLVVAFSVDHELGTEGNRVSEVVIQVLK